MFDNIGSKIKTLAKIIFCIEIIACVITGIVLMATDDELIIWGILTALVGSFFSWISLFLLYGFGQLVENSDILCGNNFSETAIAKIKLANKTQKIASNDDKTTISDNNIEDLSPEDQLKKYITDELEKKEKSDDLLSVYWKYKKYVYGYYPKEETKEALYDLIIKCKNTDYESNSKLMIAV